jgi:hypothetical protein
MASRAMVAVRISAGHPNLGRTRANASLRPKRRGAILCGLPIIEGCGRQCNRFVDFCWKQHALRSKMSGGWEWFGFSRERGHNLTSPFPTRASSAPTARAPSCAIPKAVTFASYTLRVAPSPPNISKHSSDAIARGPKIRRSRASK